MAHQLCLTPTPRMKPNCPGRSMEPHVTPTNRWWRALPASQADAGLPPSARGDRDGDHHSRPGARRSASSHLYTRLSRSLES